MDSPPVEQFLFTKYGAPTLHLSLKKYGTPTLYFQTIFMYLFSHRSKEILLIKSHLLSEILLQKGTTNATIMLSITTYN